jgi:hypothetical protein
MCMCKEACRHPRRQRQTERETQTPIMARAIRRRKRERERAREREKERECVCVCVRENKGCTCSVTLLTALPTAVARKKVQNGTSKKPEKAPAKSNNGLGICPQAHTGTHRHTQAHTSTHKHTGTHRHTQARKRHSACGLSARLATQRQRRGVGGPPMRGA